MAVYQKNKIQEDVRTALDQNMNSDTLKIIGDVDTLALDDIIASKILEAVKRVHSSAPSYLTADTTSVMPYIGKSMKADGYYCRKISCVLSFSK